MASRCPSKCWPQPHTRGPNTNILALSIALSVSSILTTATVAGAFVSSINSRRLPPFVVPTPSRTLSRTLSRAMSSEGSDDDDAGELPAAGSFFNAVPPPADASSDDAAPTDGDAPAAAEDDSDMFEQILQRTQVGRPGGGRGFSRTAPATDPAAPSVIQTAAGEKKSFVGIGRPLNDVQNPEYDADGHTLYADEVTGEKKRVFEALVDYPSVFKMKIVGQDDAEESFAPAMVAVVARSCGVDRSMVKSTTRKNGKWTSVTVHAPVKSADMLYKLYEDVDKDPRVKFKF